MTGKEALIDSNIFIYISQKKLDFEILLNDYDAFYASIISYMEVLGFNFKSEDEKIIIDTLFEDIEVLDLNAEIVKKVIELRRTSKIKLPDAIVLATAEVHQLDLITRNVKDFENMNTSVKLVNPFNDK